jgi:hypothetical protein
MKKIIKPGKKEFFITCPKCGCQFTYEISDVTLNSVQCPDCFNYVAHPRQVYDGLLSESWD